MNVHLETEFIEKGCKSRRDASIAVQVYLELCEVKKYWEVAYFYSDVLEKIYFTAKKSKSENSSIFVPIAVSETISFLDLQRLFKLCDNFTSQTVHIVIVHSDSTCVYYQITDGLGQPPAVISKNTKEDKSQKLDVDLKKNKKIIEQAALYGLPVTIPKKQKTEAGTSGTYK